MRRSSPLVVVVAVACATFGLGVEAAGAVSRARTPLRGTNWVLTDRVSIGTPLDDVAVNAVFGATRVEGRSGCNGYSNSYTTHRGRMSIENDGVSTQIACGGAADEVERKYRAALVRVGRFRIRGTTLTLSTRAGRRLLVYRASTGTRALRGSWTVNSLYTGTAISSPVPGSPLTLEFGSKQVTGKSGCNSFGGPFEVSGTDGISIGPFKTTLIGCLDPAISAQEQEYLAALGLAKTYRVTGDSLTLFRAGDTIAVTAERSS
jgi:heat shock protein HslJ